MLVCVGCSGVPAPELLLRVGGRRPGLLMHFASEAATAAAVKALRAASLRLSALPPPLSADDAAAAAGSGLGPGSSHGGQPQLDPSANGPNGPLGLGGGAVPAEGFARSVSLLQGGPSGSGRALPAGAEGAGGALAPSGAAAASQGAGALGGGIAVGPMQEDPRLPPPEYMSKTLWVGEVCIYLRKPVSYNVI